MANKLLDCTLRDGGFYNNWNFEAPLVQRYLEAMKSSNIDFIELGLRGFPSNKFQGPYAFSTRQFLNRINIPNGLSCGVMVDAKTLLVDGKEPKDLVDQLFEDVDKEPFELVRVAAHLDEVERMPTVLQHLKNKGFLVGLNIMQVSRATSTRLSQVTSFVGQADYIDVLYFADSLGSMNKKDVKRVFEAIRKNWDGDIGFHAHNNLGRAVQNAEYANELGCSWLDGTVTGMGRGAGNAETELLLAGDLLGLKGEMSEKLSLLISEDFIEMKKRFGWGCSVDYMFAAKNNIHPTYVQEIAENVKEVSVRGKILQNLAEIKDTFRYSEATLDLAKSNIISQIDARDGTEPEIDLKGRPIVLVAQTEELESYIDGVQDFVDSRNAFAISINIPRPGLTVSYDAIALTHNEKIIYEVSQYNKNLENVLAPAILFDNGGEQSLDVRFNYGFEVVDDRFEPKDKYCVIPSRLTLAYAAAFCLQAGANEFFLVGFTGYSYDDPRRGAMEQFLQLAKKKDLKLTALTPTSYKIQATSLYALY